MNRPRAGGRRWAACNILAVDDEADFEPRLRPTLVAAPPKGARSANAAVFGAMKAFAVDAPQFDDIACLTLRRAGSER